MKEVTKMIIEEINFELLSTVKRLHVIEATNEGDFVCEADGIETVVNTVTMEMAILDNDIQVSYDEESDNVKDALKCLCLSVKYVSVETFADGGKEHDVYVHKAKMNDGNVVMNTQGEFAKSYKRESSAIKFAQSLGGEVKVF